MAERDDIVTTMLMEFATCPLSASTTAAVFVVDVQPIYLRGEALSSGMWTPVGQQMPPRRPMLHVLPLGFDPRGK